MIAGSGIAFHLTRDNNSEASILLGHDFVCSLMVNALSVEFDTQNDGSYDISK